MNLLIDIGNSRIKWLQYDSKEKNFSDSQAIDYGSMQSSDDAHEKIKKELLEHWNKLQVPEAISISSVATSIMTDLIENVTNELWEISPEYVATEQSSFGLENAYTDYTKLGVDRWMAMVAAWKKYELEQKTICVIDCGTAITVDAISSEGEHLGGLILPGYSMMQKALTINTADVASDGKVVSQLKLSDTTEAAVNNGCYVAALSAMNEIPNLLKLSNHKELQFIITGGSAPLFLQSLRFDCDHVPDLVLHGLSVFLENKA